MHAKSESSDGAAVRTRIHIRKKKLTVIYGKPLVIHVK